MHRRHHAIEIRDGVNFATKFAWWDWLFGTAFRPARKPTGFGLTDPGRGPPPRHRNFRGAAKRRSVRGHFWRRCRVTMERRQRVGLLHRWSIALSMVVLWGLGSSPRAQAVPISQREQPPAQDEVPTPTRPVQRGGGGQVSDPDAPPVPRSRRTSDHPTTNDHLGIGYKVGNGLGFLGADMIVSPAPHVALDFQVSVFSVQTPTRSANGFGLAPMLQGFFYDPPRSSGYVSLGFLYASASLQNAHASVTGIAANLGYEWRWESGFAILLGGGVAVLQDATATDGPSTVRINGGFHPNLEFGIRYRCCI